MKRPQWRLRRGRAYAGESRHSPPWGFARRISGTAVGCRCGRGSRAADEAAGGAGGGSAAANKSTGPPWGTSSPWKTARTAAGMSSRTWPRRGERGNGRRRRRGGHRTAVGVFASANKSAPTVVGGKFADKSVRERRSGDRSCGRSHGTAEGDVASANQPARSSVGVANAAVRWPRGSLLPRTSEWTVVEDVATDQGRGGRARPAGANEATRRPWGA